MEKVFIKNVKGRIEAERRVRNMADTVVGDPVSDGRSVKELLGMGWAGLYRMVPKPDLGAAALIARPLDPEESEVEAAKRIADTFKGAFGPAPIETIGPRTAKKGTVRKKRGR